MEILVHKEFSRISGHFKLYFTDSRCGISSMLIFPIFRRFVLFG